MYGGMRIYMNLSGIVNACPGQVSGDIFSFNSEYVFEKIFHKSVLNTEKMESINPGIEISRTRWFLGMRYIFPRCLWDLASLGSQCSIWTSQPLWEGGNKKHGEEATDRCWHTGFPGWSCIYLLPRVGRHVLRRCSSEAAWNMHLQSAPAFFWKWCTCSTC